MQEQPFLTDAEEIAQTERIGLGDLVIAGLLAVVTWALSTCWEYPGLYPSIWNDAVVASGVRPATAVVPGYWTAISSLVYSFVGNAGAGAALRFLGHLGLAAVAVCVYAVLREWLAFAMRMRPQLSRRRTLVMRLASVVGAVACVVADPVWAAGQCLSETLIMLGLTLAALESLFVFLRKGEIKYIYLGAAFLGFISAESPLGFVIAALFVWLVMFIAKVMPALESPLYRPEIMEVGKWHATFAFLATLVVGIGVNVMVYLMHDGVDAIGETIGSIPLTYLLNYWGRIANAADIGAWILWVGIAIVPFVVTAIKFPSSADEEQFLSYGAGIIFLICGAIAFSQSACIPALWFWTYFPVNSQFLLTIGVFCCAAVLAGAITILGVDSLCRNHARLAGQVFGEDETDDATPISVSVSSRSTDILRKLGLAIIPLFLLAMMVPSRVKTGTREMLTIINDSIAAIVREAGDAKVIFTDGSVDTALELIGARTGHPLYCYSMLAGGSAMDIHLRTRGITDKEDLFSLTHDASIGLRSWIRDNPDRLKGAAVMIGFDLWRRDGRPLPPIGGFLSRPAGFADESTREASVSEARLLIDRIVDCYKRGYVKACTEQPVLDKFLAIQWRLARMCFYRGEVKDMQGDADGAIAEVETHKQLNDLNPQYQELLEAIEKSSAAFLQQLTPREGLQLALVRADFTMGKLYSETILQADPDNPDANFAMGMFYLQEHQLSRAEVYLKRCLIRKPAEPAVFNNLAMIQIELKKFEAAKVNVEKALKLVPGSTAVMDTKKALEAAVKKAAASSK